MRGLSAGVVWTTLLTWLFALERGALGLQFYLSSGSQVCLTEELLTNSHVRGEVLVVTGRGAMAVDLTVGRCLVLNWWRWAARRRPRESLMLNCGVTCR